MQALSWCNRQTLQETSWDDVCHKVSFEVRGSLEGVLASLDGSVLSREEARRIETDFKYEGYLAQQEKQMERMKRAESHRIPDWFDYRKVSGLSREVVEKFTKVRPLTLGQALRIPGITPAAVSLVNVYIEVFQRRAAQASR